MKTSTNVDNYVEYSFFLAILLAQYFENTYLRMLKPTKTKTYNI